MSLQPKLLSRPSPSSPPKSVSNIFASDPQLQSPLLKSQHLPNIYDFVGPSSIRQQLLSQKATESRLALESLSQLQEKRHLTKQAELRQTLRGTIHRSTIMSKFTRSEAKQLTRDRRNMQFFRAYEDRWSKQDALTRMRMSADKPTLLERSRKKLQVMPNPQKDDIIKNYVTSYWEMSLRNHNPTLKLHMKGQKQYHEDQLEALLQREEGVREIEQSMPRLPVEKLSKLNPRELILTGRNKLAKESASCDPSVVSQYTERRSLAHTDIPHQTWRQDYDAHHRYMHEPQSSLPV